MPITRRSLRAWRGLVGVVKVLCSVMEQLTAEYTWGLDAVGRLRGCMGVWG